MPAGSNPVWDVGIGGVPTMHGQGRYVQRENQMADHLSGLRRGTHIGIDDRVPTAYA